MQIVSAKWRTIEFAICLFFIAQAGLTQEAPHNNPLRTIGFSGQEWIVKDSHGVAVGPGANLFATENAWIKDGHLHLRIDRRDGRWRSAEVISKTSFGYGSYDFKILSDIGDLDPNAVLGLFTWSDAPDYDHREIDIEISRWQSILNPNCQCVVQPYDETGHVAHFDIPTDRSGTSFQFNWEPHEVRCAVSYALDHDPTKPRTVGFGHRFKTNIPVPGGENTRISLWLAASKPPARGAEVEVVIGSFRFTPKKRR